MRSASTPPPDRSALRRARRRRATASPARATRSSDGSVAQDAAAAAAGRRVQRRGAGEVPRVQGGAPRCGRLHGDGGRVRQVPRRRLLRAAGAARGARPTSARSSWSAPGFAGLLLWHKLQRGGLHRRALLREGRRRRRHLVLEPLSRASPATSSRTATCRCWRRWATSRRMKFASGFEILEYCQTHGREVRLLRALPVPHHRREDGVGRGDRALDRLHRPRRRHARALRRSWPTAS